MFQEPVSLGTGTAGELQPKAPNPASGFVQGTDYVAIVADFNSAQRGLAGTVRQGFAEQAVIAPPQLSTAGEHHVV